MTTLAERYQKDVVTIQGEATARDVADTMRARAVGVFFVAFVANSFT